jgi:hypothetical protein
MEINHTGKLTKIFPLDYWQVEISTHWSTLASAILIWRVHFEAISQNGEIREKNISHTVLISSTMISTLYRVQHCT